MYKKQRTTVRQALNYISRQVLLLQEPEHDLQHELVIDHALVGAVPIPVLQTQQQGEV